jgi:hypothetical protein
MNQIGKTARLTLWAASLAVLSLLNAGALRAQDIRTIAEPNQAVKMGRGGYVCEGQLTHTPIGENSDWTVDWTYEMVRCTGPLYNSNDYAAMHSKLTYDELVKLNGALERLNATTSTTQELLNKQAQDSNSDLKAAIEKRFQDLPHDLLLSASIQNLKKSLIDYVDQRSPRPPANNPPPPRSATPAKSQPTPVPNQP